MHNPPCTTRRAHPSALTPKRGYDGVLPVDGRYAEALFNGTRRAWILRWLMRQPLAVMTAVSS